MATTTTDAVAARQAAAFTELPRAWLKALALPRLAEQARTARVGTTPHDVVYDEGTFRLLRYRRDTPATHAEPLLVCYALVNRAYVVDLQPDKSVVRQYLARGFDVYLMDWTPPTAADRHLGLDDYVRGSLRRAADYVLREHRRDDLNLLGYCMGGTMSAAFTALYPRRVKNLTLMAAPIDFAGRDALLHLWTAAEHFDVDAFLDAYGNCPGHFLQTSFLLMKPVQNLVEKYTTFYENMLEPRFTESFFAMEKWSNDGVAVAGATFRDFVKHLYQGNELVRGEFRLGGRPVDLGKVVCPLLLLTAKNDHLVLPASTEGIRAVVGSKDIASMSVEAGHIGLAVSGKAHKSLWPAATAWLADRSTPAAGGA